VSWDFGAVAPFLPDLFAGALTTIWMTFLVLIVGTVTGLFLAVLRTSGRRWITIPTSLYVDFFRTTPPIVQIIWIYFVVPQYLPVDLGPFEAAVVALGLNIGAFLSETFRAGIEAVGRGQRDAARVLGLTRVQEFRWVVLPQAFRTILPPAVTTAALTVKSTSLAAILAVLELTYRGTLISQLTLRPLEVFTLIALIYFVMVYPLWATGRYLERRMSVSRREGALGGDPARAIEAAAA
jgi:polar amino acid transport system permease protein